jgi:hypothetical protein
MKKLYRSGGYIKADLIEDALINAKNEGKLPNVPRTKIKYFVEEFEEKMKEFKSRVGTQINKEEVKFLIRQMMYDKHDKILDSELRVIEGILLDKDFDID